MGHPRPWRSTSFAQASQKRWWSHGTSAICASRWATRHTSKSFMSLAGTCSDGRDDGPKLSWSQLRSFCCQCFCAVAFDLRSTLLRRLGYVRLSILCRSRVFQSRVFSEQLARNFFDSTVQQTSCLHHLLPPPRDPALLSRLRARSKFPCIPNRAKKY